MYVSRTGDGSSIEHLIQLCHERRYMLSEKSAAWIEDLFNRSVRAMRQREVAQLEWCFSSVA